MPLFFYSVYVKNHKRKERDRKLTSNDNYYYKNYFTVFKKYLLVKKEKLVHPYWNLQNRTEPIRKEAGN